MRGGSRNYPSPEWQNPPNRRRKKQEYRERKLVTSFYVANLEADCDPKELALVFDPYGKVVDTYVTGRKDRDGFFFGFVRFQGVSDKTALEEKLQGVKMNNLVLSVNLAKHVKEESQNSASIPLPQKSSPVSVPTYPRSSGGVSYAQMVKPTQVTQNTDTLIKFDSSDSVASRHWAVSSVVGRAIDLQKLNSMSSFFADFSSPPPIIRYIGGLFVLVSFPNPQNVKSFMEKEAIWKSQFTKVEPWSGQSLPYERIAFVNIHGVPVSLWDKSTFDVIASHCGRIIQPSKADLYNVNLSADPVVILVNSAQKVSKEVSIIWNKKTFKCWVIEEESKWVPEFLGIPSTCFFSGNGEFAVPSDESQATSDDGSNFTKHSKQSGDANNTVKVVNADNHSDSQDLEEGEIRTNEDVTNIEEVIPLPNDVGSPNTMQVTIDYMDHSKVNENSEYGPTLAPSHSSHNNDVGPQPISRKRPRTLEPPDCEFPLELNRVFGSTVFNPGCSLNAISSRFLSNCTPPPPPPSMTLAPTLFATTQPTHSFSLPPLFEHVVNSPQVTDHSIAQQHTSNHILCEPSASALDSSEPVAPIGDETIKSVTCSQEGTLIDNNLGEVLATLVMADELGVNMENHVELVIEVIEVLKRRNNIHFLSIQETQLTDTGRIPLSSIWGGADYDSIAVASSGRSGGLVCCWDSSVFQKNQVFTSSNYIIVSGNWLGVNGAVNLANIYGPRDPADKRRIWEELLHLKAILDGIWVFMGDFNALRNTNERSSQTNSDNSIDDFNDFIQQANLVEYQMGGNSEFTWMKDDGSIFSKLDRFLVCERFFSLWPMASVSCLPRKWSDHNPIVLITRAMDYGPCPFKIYDSWLMDSSLIDVVKLSWESSQFLGAADFVLARKFKKLKGDIREWQKNKTRDESLIEMELESKIQFFETKAIHNSLSSMDFEIWRNTKK
ncbi:hypothetical protein QVD17_11834 [Tagetes erecta]|uniref:RRM domain-containing protein n=1 Tax=Tagetes erecta TaxID=13708 RepID=A0AAD8KU63_TARER|nr:hypothetical protein QVD17_11834 [Tagetes erecta]